MTAQTPPGWYSDPYGTPSLQRWWDGGQWTQATQPSSDWDETGAQQVPGYPPQPAAPEPGWGGGPEAWQQPGPGMPQPGPMMPYAAEQQRSNSGVIWALAGGGSLVLILIVVVALLAAGAFTPRTSPTAEPTLPSPPSSGSAGPQPTPTNTAYQPGTSSPSPVTGTVTDRASGLSFDQLGGLWAAATPLDPAKNLNYTMAEQALVQVNFDGKGNGWYASAYSGLLNSAKVPYGGVGDLATAAHTEFATLEPTFYAVQHTDADVASKAYTVSGKQAWYYEVKITYPSAQNNGWYWRTEEAVLIMVDRGSQPPAVFYVSIPDGFQNQGDLALLVSSLKSS